MKSFSEYIKNRHVQFLDSVDKIGSVAILADDNNVSLLYVGIGGNFYQIGFIDYTADCKVRICGELVGIDSILSDVNVFISSFYDIGSTDSIAILNRELIMMIELQDFYIENDIPFTHCNCNVSYIR
jgi:hypothetical protein